MEALTKRTEPFNGNVFQDWKLEFELPVKANQTGALGLLQNSETSVKEFPVSISEVEHQTASQIVLARKLEGGIRPGLPEQNGFEAWRRLCSKFDSRTVGKRVHLIRNCTKPSKIKKMQKATRRSNGEKTAPADPKPKIMNKSRTDSIWVSCLKMVPPNITETLVVRLPDKNAKDEEDCEVLGGEGDLVYQETADGEGPDESSSGELLSGNCNEYCHHAAQCRTTQAKARAKEVTS